MTMKPILGLVVVLALGCARHDAPVLTAGMPFATVHKALVQSGAYPTVLQTAGGNETHIYHDYQLPDGGLLWVVVSRTDHTVSDLRLLKKVDPQAGKTLGKWEQVKRVRLEDHRRGH